MIKKILIFITNIFLWFINRRIKEIEVVTDYELESFNQLSDGSFSARGYGRTKPILRLEKI